MRPFQWVGVCLLLLCLRAEALAQGTAPRAPTQGPYVRPQVNPYQRPAVSPYLNFSRGGNPALNYYNLVRPQLEFQSTLNVLDNRADLLGQSLEEGRAVGGLTGHPSQFMTHGRYFFNLGTRQATAQPATLPPAVLGTGRRGN